MANLTAPPIDWGGDEPQSQGTLVDVIAVPGLAVYTGGILSSPAVNQLVPPAPIPDAGLFVWQRSVVDGAGNLVVDARVDVRHAETNAVAEIFEDRDGTTRRQNPFLVDAEGFARFYAAAGLYKITASRAGLERIFENVLLGIRLEDMPDLTSIVAPIVADVLEPEVDALEDQIAALPRLERFTVLDTGTGQNMPTGYTSERISLGYYRVVHNEGTVNYHPKLTVWDPSSDRVFGAAMYAKDSNSFEYVVRSIHDEASASDAQVDIEITF